MDVLTPAQRSFCMSRIRGRDTKPERAFRSALWRLGLRYRIHHALPGRPDVVFPAQRIAVFVDGCFWHGCPEHCAEPRTNESFWRQKLELNAKRDRTVNTLLQAKGWSVLRFWEHELKNDLSGVVEKIVRTKEGAGVNGNMERD